MTTSQSEQGRAGLLRKATHYFEDPSWIESAADDAAEDATLGELGQCKHLSDHTDINSQVSLTSSIVVSELGAADCDIVWYWSGSASS